MDKVDPSGRSRLDLIHWGVGMMAEDPASKRGEGDYRAHFPRSDAQDIANGARFIPGDVTLERREGKRVLFVRDCGSPNCWYWEFSDGTRRYHYDGHVLYEIARHNGRLDEEGKIIDGEPGPCPQCGNLLVRGAGHGRVNPDK